MNPGQVTDLVVEQVDGQTVLDVTWTSVTSPPTCDLSYGVTWSYTDGNNTEFIGNDTTENTEYTITDLTFEAAYIVCVYPTVDGQNFSESCQEENVVESRLSMKLLPTATSITVKWSLIPNADSYFILWLDGNDGAWHTVYGSVSEFTITDLLPCTNYSVRLDGKAGEETLLTENDSILTLPTAPSPVSDLTVTQVDREPALEVTWSPVTPPGKCDLTYRIIWSFSNNTKAGSNTTSETLYTIHNLSYGAKYTVCVDSWVEVYNATQECDFGTTISSKLALHLEATSTTISVYWTKVDEAETYYIEWTDGNYGAWTSLDSAFDTFDITDLLPGTNYTVYLNAKQGSEVLESDVDSIVTLVEASDGQILRGMRLPSLTARKSPEKSLTTRENPRQKTTKKRLPPLASAMTHTRLPQFLSRMNRMVVKP
ncbi:hypothetical protein Pmani_013385 [Petrolisthes manimaculis]|uniref:Fibronectin type-III domain-containing protein n=1 Tax=Petrolisthes manimaculis TaxID=1843537 RepID=A0AAE1UDS4_9EUCA|nr:hypothetical protein Pmani_013385 [Petrolisthes manimaculis]